MRIPAHTILAVLFLAASCARVAVDADRVYEGDYDSYLGVLSEWTRTDKVYHNFETELVVGATFHGKPYRDALRGEKARAEKLSPNEVARMTRRDEAELGRIARFTISAYMPVRQWNNLDDEEPSYRLWLVDADGRKVAPDRITVVKLETRAERLYFPIVHEWAKNYSVEFPLRDDDGELLRLSGGRVTLLAAGIQGTARLEWDVP